MTLQQVAETINAKLAGSVFNKARASAWSKNGTNRIYLNVPNGMGSMWYEFSGSEWKDMGSWKGQTHMRNSIEPWFAGLTVAEAVAKPAISYVPENLMAQESPNEFVENLLSADSLDS